MDNREIIKTAILDTLNWTGLTSAVGLVQAIIHFTVASFVTRVTFSFSGLVESGVLISFCLAIVASIYFDVHFQKKHNKGVSINQFDDLFFKLFPWVIILMVTISTVLSLVLSAADLDKEAITNTQISAIALAYIYTMYYKYNSYIIGLKNAF